MKYNKFAIDLLSNFKPAEGYEFGYMTGSLFGEKEIHGLSLFYIEEEKKAEKIITNPNTFCKDLGEFLIEISNLK